MKTILLTGGGTAGHVTPNLALLPQLRAAGWHIEYIGSETGIEKQLAEKANLPYHAIASGKLRRYFDLQNFKDPFKVIKGALQAYSLIKKIKPGIVFSKGGFVSVPVVFAAWCQRIPVIIHESDITPGLANRLAAPFAAKVCLTFPEGLKHFSEGKGVYTGSPIRSEILQGNAEKGLQLCSFTNTKPVLLVMGGSLGSEKINRQVRSQIGHLLKHFQIVHLCGRGNVDASYSDLKGYKQFEYLHDELPHVLAMADMVVSRAGANSICEFLALKKPMLLIPLSLQQSRGDQIVNAKSFAKQGYSQVLFEEKLIDEKLTEAVLETYQNREKYMDNMKNSPLQNSVQTIVQLIEETAK